MHRTTFTFSVLQAIAAVLAVATVLWSAGILPVQFARAASVSDFSITISDSDLSVGADYTVEFETPNGVGTSSSITLTFPAGFDISAIADDDVDLLVDAVNVPIANWSLDVSGQVLTIEEPGAADLVAPGSVVTILIGQHATNEGAPTNQIVNPNTADSYQIELTAGADSGNARVAIIDDVLVTATVETVFNFSISGINGNTTVGAVTTSAGVDTTAVEVPFGSLPAGLGPVTAAQELTVSTNAANGFSVTVETDQQLTAGNGADIDSFSNGTDVAVPTAWTAPSNTLGNENTYGHWGMSVTDPAYGNGADFVAVATTPTEVYSYNAPIENGSSSVIYRAEITALQEAATDYEATLTYIATPVF